MILGRDIKQFELKGIEIGQQNYRINGLIQLFWVRFREGFWLL